MCVTAWLQLVGKWNLVYYFYWWIFSDTWHFQVFSVCSSMLQTLNFGVDKFLNLFNVAYFGFLIVHVYYSAQMLPEIYMVDMQTEWGHLTLRGTSQILSLRSVLHSHVACTTNFLVVSVLGCPGWHGKNRNVSIHTVAEAPMNYSTSKVGSRAPSQGPTLKLFKSKWKLWIVHGGSIHFF